MSTQPLEQAIQATRGVLEKVRPDQLSNSTPCKSWTVSDVINHIVGAHSFFITGLTDNPSTPPENPASSDFVAAYDQSSADCLAAFKGEGAMEKTITLPFGQMPGAAFAGLAAIDTFQHGWDVAKATGQDTNLAPELAEQLLAGTKMTISDAFRGADGVAPFGPEQEAPAGSSTADRLAAFLGRSV
jgi:uncharacterized protein (TIGR03086 family)